MELGNFFLRHQCSGQISQTLRLCPTDSVGQSSTLPMSVWFARENTLAYFSKKLWLKNKRFVKLILGGIIEKCYKTFFSSSFMLQTGKLECLSLQGPVLQSVMICNLQKINRFRGKLVASFLLSVTSTLAWTNTLACFEIQGPML